MQDNTSLGVTCTHPIWIYCNCEYLRKKELKRQRNELRQYNRTDLCKEYLCHNIAKQPIGYCRNHSPNRDHTRYDEHCIYFNCNNYGFRKLNSNISYTGDRHRDYGFALYYCEDHKDYKCYDTRFCIGSNKTSAKHECEFSCAKCYDDCTEHVTSGDWENCYSKGYYCHYCD